MDTAVSIPSSEWNHIEDGCRLREERRLWGLSVSISYVQLLVCNQIREATTEEARQGWIAVDDWINQRVRQLQAKNGGIPASSLPVWMLLPD
jgi:hypothetical protein